MRVCYVLIVSYGLAGVKTRNIVTGKYVYSSEIESKNYYEKSSFDVGKLTVRLTSHINARVYKTIIQSATTYRS